MPHRRVCSAPDGPRRGRAETLGRAQRSRGARFAIFTAAFLLSGCGGVLDPAGPIGRSDRLILLNSLAIMLAIIVPIILATFAVAWWFRASNARALRLPDWSYSGRIELVVWSVPLMVVLFLGGVGWVGSHDLDPYKPIASSGKPLEIEVVSMDWKWLFIYPDLGVASVNRLVIPAGVPVHFRLTSASVMNSFFVPRLGSQIYTMAGMVSQLNLEADKPGSYPGLSAQFSGAGFSDMNFTVAAVAPSQFAGWVAAARTSGAILDAPTYAQLAKPSRTVPAAIYRAASPQLFDAILSQSAPAGMTASAMPAPDKSSPRIGG